jgi:glycosyltransferase involved in cell wall biosynthesis
MKKKPFVSVIIPTYNRVNTLGRAIDSVLKQTFTNFEIIVVDDGSTDQTSELLSRYIDDRIRIIKHERNKGVTAAKNTGLNHIQGEWFCNLDSDDELLPETLEETLSIPAKVDPRINWVVCNCVNSQTGKLNDLVLKHDQFLDIETRMKVHGDLWGILKTSLLGNNRFNEKLPGYEATLWYKLYDNACRYYVHKGFQIIHTEGTDRITISTKRTPVWNTIYEELSKENVYLNILKKYQIKSFAKRCLLGFFFCKASRNMNTAKFWSNELKKLNGFKKYKRIASAINIMPAVLIDSFFTFFLYGVKNLKKL